MTYREAIEFLYSVGRFGVKLGLDNTSHLLRELGHPEHSFSTIHVAGTNGKGSVCSLISSILSAAGYRVGMFTSPHILSFRERIRIGHELIPEQSVCHHLARLFPIIAAMSKLPGLAHPTFFEIVTALAVDYFCDNKVDFAVVETGMGGRLDATNVLPSNLQIITSVGLEHTEHLGSTLEQVASEKAGIIKHGATVIVGELDNGPFDAVRQKAVEKKAALLRVGHQISVANRKPQFPFQRLDIVTGTRAYTGMTLPLLGEHQAVNCCLAVAAAEQLEQQAQAIDSQTIHQGVKAAQWPGRFEVIKGRPNIILDAACNPQAADALAKTLCEVVGAAPLTLIVGFLREKDYRKMCEILLPRATEILLTQPGGQRALPVRELRGVARTLFPERKVRCFGSVEEAVAAAVDFPCQQDSFVCITGSNYLLGPARQALGLDDMPPDFILSESPGSPPQTPQDKR